MYGANDFLQKCGVGYADRGDRVALAVHAEYGTPIFESFVGPLFPEPELGQAAGDVEFSVYDCNPYRARPGRFQELEFDRIDVVCERPVDVGVRNQRSCVQCPAGNRADGAVREAAKSTDYAAASWRRGNDDVEVEGDEITCPHHGARFDFRTGKAKSSCPNLPRFEVKVEGRRVLVRPSR